MASFTETFTKFATETAKWTGRPLVFVTCLGLVAAWAVSGPIFKFSDTWQLVINTSTTIITFLMVFLIQNTQNRDNNALHAKLDELIRVSAGHNSFIGIENLADKELEAILSKLDRDSEKLRQEAKSERRTAAKAASAPKTAKTPTRRAPASRKRAS